MRKGEQTRRNTRGDAEETDGKFRIKGQENIRERMRKDETRPRREET